MESPSIFSSLGPRLSSVLCALINSRTLNEPTFSLKTTKGKTYLDIVWTMQQDKPEPLVKRPDPTATIPMSAETCCVTAPKKKKWRKRKSPSQLKRDKRRREKWLARKAGEPPHQSMDSMSKVLELPRELKALDIPGQVLDTEMDTTGPPAVVTEDHLDDSTINKSDSISNVLEPPRVCKALDIPEQVLDTEMDIILPPAFRAKDHLDDSTTNKSDTDTSSSSQDPDADLYTQYTMKKITVCFCSRTTSYDGTDKLKLCTRCFEVALCDREECHYFHRKHCRRYMLV